MNIFFVPSWYPSADWPLSGIFSKEQAWAMSQQFPALNIGVSLWGQKSESNLLWANHHFKNIKKLVRYTEQDEYQKKISSNFFEFYSPALTWTDQILRGNIRGIISANERNLQRFIENVGKPTLLHAHVAFPAGFIAMHLAKKYKVPYIITEHMSPFPFACYTRKGQILPKVAQPLHHASTVIAVSPAAAADIEQKTGIKPVVIPNLVDERLFAPPAQAPQEPFTLFTLGRMVPQKGIPDLLHAIALMENKKACFRMGGEGENRDQFQQMAKELEIEDRVQWLGALARTEAAREFQQCHAFVLPSLHESMGVVYVESIACGKPIIATRCGGPEFIVHERNGLLVDVGAPKQLAEAMNFMIEHYTNYDTNKIRKDFLQRFSSEVVGRKVHSLYESVVLNNPLPPDLFPQR